MKTMWVKFCDTYKIICKNGSCPLPLAAAGSQSYI